MMQLNRVIVGVDFSAASEQAAHWVVRSLAPAAEIILAHVVELPPPPKAYGRRTPPRELQLETLRVGAAERLRRLGQAIPGARLEVLEGHFAEALDELAHTLSADVIVLGGHTRRPDDWEQSIGGAEALIGRSLVPVLVVAHPPNGAPHDILATLDDSPHAASVLLWASYVAQRSGGFATALHVIPSALADTALAAAEVVLGAPPISMADVVGATASGDIVQRLAKAQDAGASFGEFTATVAIGDPAREILGAAARMGADLIVLGRRHQGSIRRALLGSVVHGVLRDAKTSVLVIPESVASAAP